MRCGLIVSNHFNTTKITTTGEEKATIKIADGTPIIWGNWAFRLFESKNLTIENLRFDANRDTRDSYESTSHTFRIDRGCNQIRLVDLHIINAVTDNLYIVSYGDSLQVSDFMNDFEMHNCVLENAYRNNMSVIRGLNFKIIGCEFNGANGYPPEAGIDFEPNHGNPGDTRIGYLNMLVEGCTFKDNKSFGLILTDIGYISGSSTIKNNIFDNNGLNIACENNIVKNNIFINLDHKHPFTGTPTLRDGIIYFHVDGASDSNKVFNNYFYNNPTPLDMHLIGFMSNSGKDNEIFDNYEYNNNVAGFINPTWYFK